MKYEICVEVIIFLVILVLFGGSILDLIEIIFDIIKLIVWDIFLSNMFFFA